MDEPIPFVVTRWKCPHCNRGRSTRTATTEHMARCWRNPAARGCKTCKWFEVDYEGGESCAQGISLEGRPQCARCGGFGSLAEPPSFGVTECPECSGDAAEVKPGPIVGCYAWEPS